MKIYSFDFDYDRENGYDSTLMRYLLDNDVALKLFYYIDDTNSLVIDGIKEFVIDQWEWVDHSRINDEAWRVFGDACYNDYEFRREQQLHRKYGTLNHTVDQLRDLLGKDRKI
jgi:hypothetical protein